MLPESLKLLPLIASAMLKLDAFAINAKPNLGRCVAGCVCVRVCVLRASSVVSGVVVLLFLCFSVCLRV